MRRPLMLAFGVFIIAASLAAQTHDQATEKVARDNVAFASDVRIGTDVLQAGEYRVVCDREKISFTRLADGKRVLDVPCKGAELTEVSRATVAHTSVDQKTGVRFLQKLLLRGSNVEHVFE